MATNKIYLVRAKSGEGRKRLVRAQNASAALRYVVEDTLEVVYATQEDIVQTMVAQDGTAVENAEQSANPSTV